jgi:hypothetical protein
MNFDMNFQVRVTISTCSGSGVTYQMTIWSHLLSEIQDQMKALICTSSTYLSIKGIVI